MKTVETALQVNIQKILKAAEAAHSNVITLEWALGAASRFGVAQISETVLIVVVDGYVFHSPINRREFRKDRFLPHIQCLACGRNCFSLFIDGGDLRCRRCAGLIYESQRVRPPGRAYLQVQKVLARLGSHPGEVAPPRPPGMWRKTYLRHLRHLSEAYKLAFTAIPGKNRSQG